MAELADALDLGSSAARRMGSTPFIRTNLSLCPFGGFFIGNGKGDVMKVKLADVARAARKSDRVEAYVDLARGEVVCLDGKDDSVFERRIEIEDQWERYIILPNFVDDAQRTMMEDFAAKAGGARERLVAALQGAGGALRFHREVKKLLLEEKWQAYEKEAYVALAQDWCEENGIAYREG